MSEHDHLHHDSNTKRAQRERILYGGIHQVLDQIESTRLHLLRGHGIETSHSEAGNVAVGHATSMARNVRAAIALTGGEPAAMRRLEHDVEQLAHHCETVERAVTALIAGDRLARRIGIASAASETPAEVVALRAQADVVAAALRSANESSSDDRPSQHAPLATAVHEMRRLTAAAAEVYAHLN